MKIKRIRNLKVNSYHFKVKWNRKDDGAFFSYLNHEISIGIKTNNEQEIFMIICHELMEIAAMEMNVRLNRPDCQTDYIFVYDHRQHETMMNLFASLLSQFIE